MDDKRTALAIFLIIMVVLVYSELVISPYTRRSAPPPPPPAEEQTQPLHPAGEPRPASPEAGATEVHSAAAAEAPAVDSYPLASEIAAHPHTIIETAKAIITFSHLGGRVSSLKLKEYSSHLGDPAPLDLVSSIEGSPLPLGLHYGGISDARTVYELQGGYAKASQRFSLAPGQEQTLTFTGALTKDQVITKRLSFSGDSYLFNVETRVSESTPGAAASSELWLEWAHYIADPLSPNRLDPKRFTLLQDNNKLKHTGTDEIVKRNANHLMAAGGIAQKLFLLPPAGATWSAFDDKYFTATLIPESRGPNTRIGFAGNAMLLRVRGSADDGRFAVYAGPKQYHVLKQLNRQLERGIDLGFFAFLAYPLLLLLRIFDQFLNNYGLSVVLLTLVVRGVFLPLNRASLKSMQAMQQLAPEMKALRERIKDPAQLNQEMMALYKKHGVNPMGGCLPIVIQIPVFFGLYSALANAIELRHAHFALWIRDLSAPERLELGGINFPVMTLLMGAIMFLQQYITPSPSMDPRQRKTMLIVSLIFPVMFLIYPFPAGLALYILVSTAIGVIQAAYMRDAKGLNTVRATAIGSAAIFLFAFILTKI